MKLLPSKIAGWVDAHSGKAATLAAWFTQGVGLVSALGSVPLIMRAYDKPTAGIWYFLLGWATFFQLCDFGFSQAISRQISYSHASGNRRAKRAPGTLFLSVRGPRAVAQFYASTRRLFRFLTIGMLVVAVVAERTFLFSGNINGTADARICWYLIAGMALALNEARAPGTLLIGCFQIAWMRIAAAFCTLLQNVVFLAALVFRPPLWVGGVIFLAGGVAQWWAFSRLARSRCPLPSIPPPRRSVIRAIWTMSWQQGVSSTAGWFIFSVNPMIVGYWLGEAAVSALAIPTRVAMLLFAILAEIATPQLNYMVRLMGEGDVRGLLRKFFLGALFIALPGAVAYAGFAAAGLPFIRWWTLGQVNLDFGTIGWLALYSWLALMQLPPACLVTAHGRQPFAIPATLGALLNVGLGCWLVPRYGIAGAPLATLLAQLVTSNWVSVVFAGQHLAAYAKKSPGIVGESFRSAVVEVFSLRFFKTLFAR